MIAAMTLDFLFWKHKFPIKMKNAVALKWVAVGRWKSGMINWKFKNASSLRKKFLVPFLCGDLTIGFGLVAHCRLFTWSIVIKRLGDVVNQQGNCTRCFALSEIFFTIPNPSTSIFRIFSSSSSQSS